MVKEKKKNSDKETKTNSDKETGTYKDYCQLFDGVFSGEIKRDIVSDRLMWWSEGKWRPIFTKPLLGKLKSIAHDSKGFFKANQIESHLYRLMDETNPDLLINIPAWDKVDRIKQIASCLNLDPVARLAPLIVEYVIKDFGARMFDRIKDPMVQNRCLIFTGAQGTGKDTLIDVLVGGLGHYVRDLIISEKPEEKEINRLISQGLVINISEFDRVCKIQSSTLKNILTKPFADIRANFQDDFEHHDLRCSFIGSANTIDLFRDHTGNRRYSLIELKGRPGEAIKSPYPGYDKKKSRAENDKEKLQIIAQFKHYSDTAWYPDPLLKVMDVMERRLKELTPTDPAQEMAIDFDRMVEAIAKNCHKQDGKIWIPSTVLTDMCKELGKRYGFKQHDAKHKLKLIRNLRDKHTNRGDFFLLSYTSELVEPEKVKTVKKAINESSPDSSLISH